MTTGVRLRLRRAWFYLRSFFRRHWTLDDYPIVVRRQDRPAEGDDAAGAGRDVTWQPYLAMIDGMMIAGLGDTPQAARTELAKRFEDYQAAHETLPRPGTRAPVQFASSARIEAHGSLRDEFIERVFKMDPDAVFVSDGSSLGEFPDGVEEYARRIMLLYGIDVDDLPDVRLTTVLDAIADRPARGGRV